MTADLSVKIIYSESYNCTIDKNIIAVAGGLKSVSTLERIHSKLMSIHQRIVTFFLMNLPETKIFEFIKLFKPLCTDLEFDGT